MPTPHPARSRPARHRALGPWALLCAALLLVSASSAHGQVSERATDSVHTTNGRVHTGYLLFENADKVLLRDGSRLREFQREEVVRVGSTREALRILLIHLYDAQLGDLKALKEIAQYAEHHGLHNTAQLIWWKAVLRDPEDAESLRAIGSRLNAGRWEIPHQGKWWTLKDLLQRTREWDHGWEFTSLHFQVRSNLSLHQTLDAVLDLEHFYSAYFRFFAPHLELHELLEPMRFEIYRDTKSFPKIGFLSRSYFDPAENTAIINAANFYDRGTLIHEASHAILHNLGLTERRFSMPAWVDEGIAEYFRAGCFGPMGRMRVEPGAVIDTHFNAQKHNSKGFKLSRVLNIGKGDYLSGSDPAMKYAQSYTLVDFLLHGEESARREAFFKFIDWCYEGRSSSTHFKKVLDEGEKALEKGWAKHVDVVVDGDSDGRRRIP